MRDAGFARNSEVLSLLALVYHLGSPASSEQVVREIRQATADARKEAEGILKKENPADDPSTASLVLDWPFFEEQLNKKPEVIRQLSPEVWRAACCSVMAELVLESIESREAIEEQTQDPNVIAQLSQAQRDFAKWSPLGPGDIEVRYLSSISQQNVVFDRKEGLELLVRYTRNTDRDKDGKISVLEYAQSLASLAKQKLLTPR